MYASTFETKLLAAAVITLGISHLLNTSDLLSHDYYLKRHTHDVNQQDDGTYFVSLPKNAPYNGGDYLYLSGAWF